MVDYTSDVHSLYLNGSGYLSPKLRVAGTLAYNASKAEMDQVIMPDVTDRLVNGAGDPELTHQDFGFEELDQYSNLDYQLISLTLGFELLFSPGVTYTLDGTYADLTDDAGYVYGVESGSFSQLRTGLRFDF